MARSDFQKLVGRIKSVSYNRGLRFFIGQVGSIDTWVLRDRDGREVSPRHTSLQSLFIWCNNNGYKPYKSPVSYMINPLIRVKK